MTVDAHMNEHAQLTGILQTLTDLLRGNRGKPQRRTIFPYVVGEAMAATPNQPARSAIAGTVLYGYMITETADAAANWKIKRGQDIQAQLIANEKLAAGATVVRFFPGDGIDVDDGIFCQRISGTVDLVLFLSNDMYGIPD